MPTYTKRNMMDLDDLAAGRMEGLQARFARSAMGFEQFGVTHFRVGPGVRAPFGHRHAVQEEAYLVLSGSGRLRVEDDILDLAPLDLVRVVPEAVRGFEGGPEGMDLLAIGGTRPEDGDGEMVQDWWTD